MRWYCDASTFKNGQVGQDSTVVVIKPDKSVIIEHIGNFTINYAEIYAVKKACELAAIEDEILTDSKNVFCWVRYFRRSKFNGHLEPLMRETQQLVRDKKLFVNWIPRGQNKAGHYFDSNPPYGKSHEVRLAAYRKRRLKEAQRINTELDKNYQQALLLDD